MIDKKQIMENYLLNQESLNKLLLLFHKSVSNDIELLQLHIDQHNMEEIQKVAHKLKAAFLYLFIHDLALHALHMEKEASSTQNLSTIKLLFDQIKSRLPMLDLMQINV